MFRRRDPLSVVFGFVVTLSGLSFLFSVLSPLLSERATLAMWEWITLTCLPLVFVVSGGLFLFFCFRARVEVSDGGIVAYGLTKEPTFEACWSEITGYKIGYDEGDIIELETASSKLVLPWNLERWTELRDLLDRRLTHLSLGAKYRIAHAESGSPPSGP